MNLLKNLIINGPWKKHPVITAISVLIVILLIWGFWPQPVFVEAVEAKRAPLTITIEEAVSYTHLTLPTTCKPCRSRGGA